MAPPTRQKQVDEYVDNFNTLYVIKKSIEMQEEDRKCTALSDCHSQRITLCVFPTSVWKSVFEALQALKLLKLLEGSLPNKEVSDGIIFTTPVTMETGGRHFWKLKELDISEGQLRLEVGRED